MEDLLGIYKGIVVFNSYGQGSTDPKAKSDASLRGRCKIWIPGITPSEYQTQPKLLPWAEPAHSLFGSDNTTGGINTVPAVGTYVWVMFEEGDYMSPVYFAVCQGGDGWVSEHVNQHTIQTERVSIVIDDIPANGTKSAVLNIVINNPDDEAVNININGHVVLNIQGNVTQTIIGNVDETIEGDVTRNITGNVTETIDGTYDIESTGVMTLKASKIDLNP